MTDKRQYGETPTSKGGEETPTTALIQFGSYRYFASWKDSEQKHLFSSELLPKM